MIESAVNNNKMGRTTLKAARDILQPRYFVTRDNQQMCIRGADNKEEVLKAEQMIRQCAKSGDGFNIDEFCSEDGHFLHKFIFQPKVLVAADSRNNIIGAAIFGLSLLSRLPGSLFGAYFVVDEGNRRKGIGSELLKTIEELSKQEKCDTLMFDLFLNNYSGISFLMKHQFLVTGSIPHCGYVVNHGLTDSLLMCKRIDKHVVSYLFAKI